MKIMRIKKIIGNFWELLEEIIDKVFNILASSTESYHMPLIPVNQVISYLHISLIIVQITVSLQDYPHHHFSCLETVFLCGHRQNSNLCGYDIKSLLISPAYDMMQLHNCTLLCLSQFTQHNLSLMSLFTSQEDIIFDYYLLLNIH